MAGDVRTLRPEAGPDARRARADAEGRGAAPARASPLVRGSLWTMGGFAAGQALRFAGNLVLTRLLFPAAFGEMALVATLIQGLQMFSDVGTGPAIVQGARGDDPRFLRTAWTVQCVRGAALWGASLLLARPVAALYGQPSLAVYLPAAGLCTVLGGLESISVYTQQRHLKLERLTLIDFASQAITVAATVLLSFAARAGLGADHPAAVWALVGGTLAGSAGRLAMTHLGLPRFRHALQLDREALAALFGFGRWIFVSTMLGFLAGQSDRLLLGKLIPLDLLGVYGIAAALAALPTQAAQRLASAVLFPGYSRRAGQDDFPSYVQRVRVPVLFAGAALVTALVACGPPLVRALYDDRYVGAGWMVQYLAVAAWLQILEATNGAVLLAQGRVAWHAANYGAKVAGLAVLVAAGFWAGGLRGALVGLVAADALKYVGSAIGVGRSGIRVLAHDAGLSALIALVSAAAIALGEAARSYGGGDVAGFLGAGATAAAAWAALSALLLLRRQGGAPVPGASGRPTSLWAASGGEAGREP